MQVKFSRNKAVAESERRQFLTKSTLGASDSIHIGPPHAVPLQPRSASDSYGLLSEQTQRAGTQQRQRLAPFHQRRQLLTLRSGQRAVGVRVHQLLKPTILLGRQSQMSHRLTEARVFQKLHGPFGVGPGQRRDRIARVIQVFVAAVDVGHVDQRLQIQPHVSVVRPEWNPNAW